MRLPNGLGQQKRVAVFCPPAEEEQAGDLSCVCVCAVPVRLQVFKDVKEPAFFFFSSPALIPFLFKQAQRGLGDGCLRCGQGLSWSDPCIVLGR